VTRNESLLLSGLLKKAKKRQIVLKMRQVKEALQCIIIWNIWWLEKNLLDLTEEGVEAKRMAEVVRDKGFKDLDEIWGSEVVISYPGLYAGQTDLCGIYQGRESIIDFKQSNKPKREEWIEDYYYQMVAYAMAHDVIHGTQIEQGVILMCTPDLFFQKFVLNGSRFRQYKWKWLWRLSEYYKKKV
jgi:genome maintenance exonuclease 1